MSHKTQLSPTSESRFSLSLSYNKVLAHILIKFSLWVNKKTKWKVWEPVSREVKVSVAPKSLFLQTIEPGLERKQARHSCFLFSNKIFDLLSSGNKRSCWVPVVFGDRNWLQGNGLLCMYIYTHASLPTLVRKRTGKYQQEQIRVGKWDSGSSAAGLSSEFSCPSRGMRRKLVSFQRQTRLSVFGAYRYQQAPFSGQCTFVAGACLINRLSREFEIKRKSFPSSTNAKKIIGNN